MTMMEEETHETASSDPVLNDSTMAEEKTSEEPPSRLLITKMELENFKSYEGVKEIGPFHKCFSSVVGPNGSGKSNVIDAMLFVFGKRAKKLRLNKVSELIHKSDAVKDNPPTFARVSVFFQEIIDRGDGDDDYDIVPNTECVVTRIARKDNSSSYKLNGKNSTFRDVAKYLDSKGIDLDNNRFLILQGEVEMISMMPPKGKTEDDDGLLEYLEDIIGSSKYVEETNLAAQKVEQLTEQRQEKLNRVKAVEKEKDSLEGAKQEAEALLTKEREIRRKRNVLYQISSMKETKKIETLNEEKKEVDEKLNAEREKEAQSKERAKELESALKQQTKQYNKIHEELTKTKEEFTAFERRDIKLREEIKHGKAQLKKAQTKVKKETEKRDDAIQKGKDAEASIPGLEEKCEELTSRKAKEDEKLEAIQVEVNEITRGLRSELEEKNKDLAPFHQELAGHQNNLDTVQHEIRLLQDSTTKAKEKLAESEKELASLDTQQQSKRDELAQGRSDLSKSQARLTEIEKEQKVLTAKEASLSQKSRDLLARTEEAKAALQFAAGGRCPVIKAIIQAARPGGELANVGVVGRLGDLCTTTAEFDVAASTAVGYLDNIVVQTTAGVQRCINFLRKHNLGRASFTPLDKMKKGLHDRPTETPEGAPRLFDQITVASPSIAPALWLGVGKTLVAPDMDTATRWAFDFGSRWRVVTLDGKLVEANGTMTGGGKQVYKGRMRISNAGSRVKSNPIDDGSTENVKRLEQESAKATELLNQCIKRRRDLTAEFRSLEKAIKVLERKLPTLTLEIKGFDTSRVELTKLVPELRAKCDLTPEETEKLKELQGNVEKYKLDISSCKTKASKLEAEVAKLQKAILDAGGTKLKKQQKTCDDLLAELTETEKALNAAKVAITSSKKAAEKATKQIATAEKQEQECTASLEEKKAEFKEIEAKAVKVHEAYEKVKEVEADKRAELDAAKKECDDLKKSHSKAKCVEIELSGKAEAIERQLAECNGKKKHWEKEIAKLQTAEEEDDEFDFSDEEDEEENDKSGASEKPAVDADGDANMESEDELEEKQSDKNERESKDSLPRLSFTALEKYSVEDIRNAIDTLEAERNNLAKNANMAAIEEYRKKEADYLLRVGELDEVTEERNACRREHEELRRKRLEMFMDGFGQITLKLKEMYQMITLGGDAELELVDSLDPFSEGIVFSVRPPKKSWKNISNLSGGEKTLSSLALVFALHHYKPTPLYVMDEIDAALDFKNVSIVANYIKERTKNAQFIIISLRNNMFELADRLVGIYKTQNCTKSVTIDPRAFGIAASQNGATPSRALAERTNASVSKSPAVSSRRKVSYGVTDEDENYLVGAASN